MYSSFYLLVQSTDLDDVEGVDELEEGRADRSAVVQLAEAAAAGAKLLPLADHLVHLSQEGPLAFGLGCNSVDILGYPPTHTLLMLEF